MSTDNSSGEKAFETLTRYLQEHDWPAERIDERTAFKARKIGEISPLDYYFQIIAEREQFLFYIVPEITLFPDMLANGAEYICRANYGMRIGNFELDFKTGQIAFKSSLNFKGVELSPALIDNVIQPALEAFDEFFPGLGRVVAELDTPAAAIAKIEYRES